MLKLLLQFSAIVFLPIACASIQRPGSVLPEPETSSQASSPSPTRDISTRSWEFKFAEEVHSYTSVTQTTIQSLSSLPSSVDTFTTRSHFSITLNQQQISSPISGQFNQTEVTHSQQVHNQPPPTSAFAFAGNINSGQIFLHPVPAPADSAFCNDPGISYLSELHAAVLRLDRYDFSNCMRQ